MYREEIFKKVQKILSEQLDIEQEKITLQSNLEIDLGADSLNAIEL